MCSPRTIAIMYQAPAPTSPRTRKTTRAVVEMGVLSMTPTGGRSGPVFRYSTFGSGAVVKLIVELRPLVHVWPPSQRAICQCTPRDRKSVASGKDGSVLIHLGGLPSLKKK